MALLKLKDTGDPDTVRRHLRKLLNAFDWLVEMERDIGDSMYKRMMLKMTKCVRSGAGPPGLAFEMIVYWPRL